jgi:hypothetical protein
MYNTVLLWDAGTGVVQSMDLTFQNLSISSQYLKTYKDLKTYKGILGLSRLLIFVSDNWVFVEEENIIWLPSNYRPTCRAAWNGIEVLGHLSGGVSFLEFELGKMAL